jgi:two-component system nitrogen regulation sensor histidine kinase NtrY
MELTSELRPAPADNLSSRGKYARPLKKIFRPKIALRVMVICFCGWSTTFLFFSTAYWMAGVWTAAAMIFFFLEAVRYMDQSERKLTSFLQSIRQNDFSVTFYENRKSDDYDLHRAFNQLNETFKLLRMEKESQHQLLQSIVETASVPMVCYDHETEVVFLANDAAKTLFQIPFLRHIKSLARAEQTLPAFIRSIRDGDKELLNFSGQGKSTVLSVSAQHIVFQNKNLKLVAFHDVSSELARKEADTWHKLLRVLTHEIANSAIPLSTLSSFIYDLLYKAQAENRAMSAEEQSDVMFSLQTIEQRSRSLREFVHNFKTVNSIPEPQMQKIDIRMAVQEVINLFKKVAADEFIEMKFSFPADPIWVYADWNLTMQVLINLIKNAVESLVNTQKKIVTIQFERIGRYVNLKIGDTGCGIRTEDLDQIFIPFFSTKKSGTGIGLSMSQQIMQKQKGDIHVESEFGRGSVFIASFAYHPDTK